MTGTPNGERFVFKSVLAATALVVAVNSATATDYRGLLKRDVAQAVVAPILTACETPKAEAELEGLTKALTERPDGAVEVLNALAAKKCGLADSVAAELVYKLAGHVGGVQLASDPAWRKVAEKGAALLGHEDPFVRGIAAWALIEVRDANEGGELPPEAEEWLAKCLVLSPESSLECDFVLQGFSLGEHRTSQTLATSAQGMVERAEKLAAYACSFGDEKKRRQVTTALQALKKTHGRGSDIGTDLTAQRKWWMQVRHAVREVVLAGPDADFERLVFFKVHGRTEGNHPDCLVQNHGRPKERRPGGDIVVQTGLKPADPTRALIDGQLGPGHIQDMDLWWDADRLVFAYSCQPYWGINQNNWGNVEWRNGPKVKVFDHLVGTQDGVFWENGSEPTHLYEINLDGSGLRQLTDDPLYCDREPAYLPGGDVVFSSDRGCGASQCGAAPLAYSDFGLPNLFRVSASDGSVVRLTFNKDVDRYPHCLSNGLIGYMRWDYQERFWQWPHSLWTIRPDGTMNDGLYKVHFREPQSVREPRSVPGGQKLVVIATGHHAPPEGAVAVVDPSQGVNNPSGMQYVTPSVSRLEGGLGTSPTVPQGGVHDRGGLYKTPWPLSENAFLVSYAYHHPSKMPYAAYYIDVWGNKELIRRDRVMDVMCPMPVQKRSRPPVLPPQEDAAAESAVCYLDDVNRDMAGVEPGTVRYLRISEKLQWFFEKDDNTGPIRWSPGTQHSRNFGYWSWSPTRVIGTVPVEKDGSAYFKVPTGVAVYFQALDENMMEIRRMRSHVEFQPGEYRSCVGCHETKHYSPAVRSRRSSLALSREPSVPKPPPWGDVAIIGYEELVQPIFNRACVDCHDGKDGKTDLDLTDARDPHGFVQSYRSLFGIKKGMPTPLGEGYREAYPEIPLLEKTEGAEYEAVKARIYNPGGLVCLSNHMGGPEVSQPKEFGSHQSRLILTLLDDDVHGDVALSKNEWETLVTWLDANAPYRSTYYQYFDAAGKLLPQAREVEVELDPPFKPGDKGFRIVTDRNSPEPGDAAQAIPALSGRLGTP